MKGFEIFGYEGFVEYFDFEFDRRKGLILICDSFFDIGVKTDIIQETIAFIEEWSE